MSRGAQLHHFPTKNDLVVAAVEHLTEVRGAELAAAAAAVPARTAPHPRRAPDARRPLRVARLHRGPGAVGGCPHRRRPCSRPSSPLEQRVGRETHRMTVDLLGADESRPGVRELVQATLDLVRGLGLAGTITDDTRRRKRILDQWARTLDEALRMNDVLDGVLADLAAEGDAARGARRRPPRRRLATPDSGGRVGRGHPDRPPGLDRRGGARGRDRQGALGRAGPRGAWPTRSTPSTERPSPAAWRRRR